jgi:hypothetical protein
MVTAGHFPPALRAAAADSVRQAFMTGLHVGSFAAAAATAAAALVALVFLPARARTGHTPVTAAAEAARAAKAPLAGGPSGEPAAGRGVAASSRGSAHDRLHARRQHLVSSR